MLIKGPAALIPMASATFTSITRDVFLALPQFIFMAAVLEMSGLGTAMYDLMHKWMAGLRGGLAMGTIGISTAMAVMSGSASTATLTMGMLAYPEMEKRGYSKSMIIGCIPAGGVVLGPLIPPSVLMIIVASVSAISIGKLFMAGFIPGLIAAGGFVAYIGIRCFLRPSMGPPLPLEERVGWFDKVKSLRGAFLPFLLILLVLGLIYTGVCAPSEAGGVGAVGALICAAIYGNFNLRNLQKATIRCLQITAMLMLLLITAAYFGQMMGILGIQIYIRDLLTGAEVSRWVILAGMLGLVFIMGMFMDPHQDIFAGNNPAILRLLMESHPAQYRLTVNCRNTDQIATATRILSGMECDEVARTNGVEVEQRWYRDRNDQRKKISDCVNRLLSEKLEPSDITILSPYRQENSCLSEGLFRVPYPLMDIADTKTSEKKAVRFSTVAAFKGLESDATILADVGDLKDTIAKINLYVGCSRARGFLAIFIDQRLRREYEELAHKYGERLIGRLRESKSVEYE